MLPCYFVYSLEYYRKPIFQNLLFLLFNSFLVYLRNIPLLTIFNILTDVFYRDIPCSNNLKSISRDFFFNILNSMRGFPYSKNVKLCFLRYIFGLFRNIPCSKKCEIMLVEVYFRNIPGIFFIPEKKLKIMILRFCGIWNILGVFRKYTSSSIISLHIF